MILGIDFGATTTNAVLLQRGQILKRASTESRAWNGRKLDSFLEGEGLAPEGIKAVAVTGGKSSLFRGKILGLKPEHVGEIDAIGAGGAFLSGLKRCLVASMGTGTCIVSFEKGRARHVAGTGIGGGTIVGLSKRLFGEERPEKLGKMAPKGSLRGIDLGVKEVVGSGIGLVPGNATASNFAKKGKAGSADLALAVQNMVAEANAVVVALAARASGQKKLVFVGKAASYPAVRASLKRALGYYGFKPVFPEQGEFAAAAGAAREREKNRSDLRLP